MMKLSCSWKIQDVTLKAKNLEDLRQPFCHGKTEGWRLPRRNGVKKRTSLSVNIDNDKQGASMINQMVLSRDIEWIGYEHSKRMLQVEFIEGSTYQYQNVPEPIYEDFLHAQSHGRFFENRIKGQFAYRRIR